MRIRSLVAVAALCAAPTVSMAQIPVTDAANIAQQAVQFAKSIAQMKMQLEQMENQYKALTGSTGMGGMLPGATSAYEQNLPKNWKRVYQDAMNSSSSITGPATDMTKQFKKQVDNMPPAEALTFIKQKMQRKGAYDRVMAQKAYDNQMRELNNMQALTNQIDSATSMKEISDLQARIQTAQGSIQGEQAKLRLMAMLQRSQDKMLRVQQERAAERYTVGDVDNGGDFNFPDITP